MEITNLHIAVAVIVGLLFPTYAMLHGGNTFKTLQTMPEQKSYVMRVTALELLLMSAVALAPVIISGGIQQIGLLFVSNPLWVIGLFVPSFIALGLFYRMEMTPEQAKNFKGQTARLQFLFPETKNEFIHTLFVSFIAGIGEEIIYRGFLLAFLNHYLPIVPAVVLANLPFALAHLTSTGWRNSVQAFLLGLVFTAAFLFTGSLWLSILLHILVDLYATVTAYKANCTLELEN